MSSGKLAGLTYCASCTSPEQRPQAIQPHSTAAYGMDDLTVDPSIKRTRDRETEDMLSRGRVDKNEMCQGGERVRGRLLGKRSISTGAWVSGGTASAGVRHR